MFSYHTGYPLVNAITVQDGGGNTVLAINCGEVAGGTITVDPGASRTRGRWRVGNGKTLNVSDLTGNLATATRQRQRQPA